MEFGANGGWAHVEKEKELQKEKTSKNVRNKTKTPRKKRFASRGAREGV